MKKSYFIAFIFVFFVFISCSKIPESSTKSKVLVYTSLYPLKHFTKWIMPEAQIEELIPSQVDPHNFEPSLKDIQKLYNANMVVYLGNTDVDRWIDKIKEDLALKGVKLVRLQDHIEFKKYSSTKELDPHLWLDPVLVLEIIRVIKDKAKEIYPENKDAYEKNFSIYTESLKELDREYRQSLSNCSLKDVVTTHEFLNYLSARYGFSFHFVVHEPDEEPSLKKIKNLKTLIKKKSIEYIISEPEGERIAKSLSEETGVKILTFNTFHKSSSSDYFQTMRENLKALKTALECR
ncbi:MAG: zinc ABC transporter substrate-binding protein [Thermodesulfovibrio sp.]|nr:zinc ABC transporter substrate-binding protein [Thermodesulfovibrio sp.]MDW7971611.1 metal ABC transporter substrate-binding protein [Thermodesulfovibrio sp.]